MKKTIFNLLTGLCIVASLASCNRSGEATQGDAAKTTTTTTNPADASASTAAATPPAEETGVDPNMPKTTMEFTDMTHDFGKIKDGDKVTHVFKFKNTGKEPLVIANAKGSCGCTVPEYPKEPVAPGASSEIKVEFNSKGKKGMQTKTVTINANTDPNPTRLTIKAEVEGGPEDAAAAAPAVKVEPKK